MRQPLNRPIDLRDGLSVHLILDLSKVLHQSWVQRAIFKQFDVGIRYKLFSKNCSPRIFNDTSPPLPSLTEGSGGDFPAYLRSALSTSRKFPLLLILRTTAEPTSRLHCLEGCPTFLTYKLLISV
ncbi:unnamed protein product [Nesidiocoris tenuis]|uniref:Uncharacterized protein n=1 Tax=Nesidiocoris tenuis TaxID=355587 RepID=A0A6H5H0Y7_9HEMI|nr:unnamed protein product [Nesidiocoris tenuis]CAB0009159.1 unnamed protein product [Nesidiocoris tenuis]